MNENTLPTEDNSTENISVQILCEIVSAKHLSKYKTVNSTDGCNDAYGWIEESAKIIAKPEVLDPRPKTKTLPVKMSTFCRVDYRGEVLHQTLMIPNDDRPIWTVETGSLFIFTTSLCEILQMSTPACSKNKNDLNFEIRNKCSSLIEVPGKVNFESVGSVTISPRTILEKYCTEERFEFELSCEDERKSGSNNAFDEIKTGYRKSLALRFRVATANDIRFVQKVSALLKQNDTLGSSLQNIFLGENNFYRYNDNHNSNKDEPILITEIDQTEATKNDMIDKMTSVAFNLQETILTLGQDFKNSQRFLVKPHPDPSHQSETRFMTKDQIELQTFTTPSHHWIRAGSGKLGKIYLEVLSCHGLPNMDIGGAIGNVTDAFVSVIYEDVMVQTPVIENELSPRWLPWTQRAFVFGIMHPYSLVYLSVSDYDLSLTGHEPIGRVAVNVGNLKKDILYTLKYDLHRSSNLKERKMQGSITIRLRIEIDDERAFLLASLKPEIPVHVNVKKEKSFDVARFTCFGEGNDEGKFEWKTCRSYIDEILEYKRNLSFAFKDMFLSLMFWRGQMKVGSIFFPIHSATFFITATTIIERPDLFPAYFFFCLAWIMLASMGSRINHPSPWVKSNSFLHYLLILLYGRCQYTEIKPNTIQSMENIEEVLNYENTWKKKLERDDKIAAIHTELDQFVNDEIGDEDIHTKTTTGLEIDLFIKLGRWQGIVGSFCNSLRHIKAILTWEKSLSSFWITMTCIICCVLCFIFPVTRILQSICKIIIWIFFGPWMKLVDSILTAKASDFDENRRKIENAIQKKIYNARIKREEAVKLQKMKIMKFGSYIVSVPVNDLPRHYDRPLAESTARPININEPSFPLGKIVESGSIPGQQLYGVMIPQGEDDMEQNREESFNKTNYLINSMNKLYEVNAFDNNDPLNTIPEKMYERMKVSGDERANNDTIHDEGFEVVLSKSSPMLEMKIYQNDKPVINMGKASTIEFERMIEPISDNKNELILFSLLTGAEVNEKQIKWPKSNEFHNECTSNKLKIS